MVVSVIYFIGGRGVGDLRRFNDDIMRRVSVISPIRHSFFLEWEFMATVQTGYILKRSNGCNSLARTCVGEDESGRVDLEDQVPY